MAVQYDVDIDTQAINRMFQEYALAHFGKLSQNIDKSSPVLVSKAMDYMSGHSEKFIIVVMDGMSEFDWRIISTAFNELALEKSSMFAMIPSTTSVSVNACCLANIQASCWSLGSRAKKKQNLFDCAKGLGYTDPQIGYERGYDAQFGSFVRCGAVIINDVE